MARESRTAGRIGTAFGLVLLALLFAVPAAGARDRQSNRLAELGSQLIPLRGGDDDAISAARGADLSVSRAEKVLVQVYVSGSLESATARLRQAGMSVKAVAEEPLPLIEGWLPATELASVAGSGFTDAVLPVTAGGSDAGLVQSEGVNAHRTPQAFSSGANSGEGVDVGVVSSSIDRVGGGIADSQANGELPDTVTVLKDGTSPNDDEGRAMAEIIYDGAPGIDSILFASGTVGGPADKADSIEQLVANGADVIADDIFWLSEPFFQDGVTAQAVDRAEAAGVTYLASAGNRARQSWEGTYADTDDSGLNDFDPGGGIDAVQSVATVPPVSGSRPNGGLLQLVVQWDEVWGGAQSDFDFELVQANGDQLPCSDPGINPSGGLDDNPATGFAAEIVTWQNNCAPGDVAVGLKISRVSGSTSPFIKYIALGNFGTFQIAEYATGSNTVNPDAASAGGALTVAAVDALDPGLDTPESFSSRGPTTKLFDKNGLRLPAPEVRNKPELAAADGLSTSVPGFETFFGTSAAVPSAASIAAILRSSSPGAPVEEIERRMTDPANAIDCIDSALVPDPDCGAGFLLADGAFLEPDRDGPSVNPVFSPARPNGKRGWYTKTVSLEWQVEDLQSEIESQNCPAAVQNFDGKRSYSCVAVSGGGTTNAVVRIKRDTVKPRVPRITRIRSRTYRLSGGRKLPAKKKIKCRSRDRTSGIFSCRVKGYSRRPGTHTLVAKATDKAGLRSVSKLRYRVRR